MILLTLVMKNFAQKIAEIGNPFNEHRKQPNYNRVLLKRVHNILIIY
jgi:hypothetical protein